MNQTNKILEAEQNLQQMVQELERMRNAVSLLANSEKQVSAVISSTQTLTKQVEQFSANCGIVINRLNSSDLLTKLQNLESVQVRSSEATQASFSSLNDRISQLEELIKNSQKFNKRLILTALLISLFSLAGVILLLLKLF